MQSICRNQQRKDVVIVNRIQCCAVLLCAHGDLKLDIKNDKLEKMRLTDLLLITLLVVHSRGDQPVCNSIHFQVYLLVQSGISVHSLMYNMTSCPRIQVHSLESRYTVQNLGTQSRIYKCMIQSLNICVSVCSTSTISLCRQSTQNLDSDLD